MLVRGHQLRGELSSDSFLGVAAPSGLAPTLTSGSFSASLLSAVWGEASHCPVPSHLAKSEIRGVMPLQKGMVICSIVVSNVYQEPGLGMGSPRGLEHKR